MQDLRVNPGRWQYSETGPHPPWSMLQRANLWSSQTKANLVDWRNTPATPIAEQVALPESPGCAGFTLDDAVFECPSSVVIWSGLQQRASPEAVRNVHLKALLYDVQQIPFPARPHVLPEALDITIPVLLWSRYPSRLKQELEWITETHVDYLVHRMAWHIRRDPVGNQTSIITTRSMAILYTANDVTTDLACFNVFFTNTQFGYKK